MLGCLHVGMLVLIVGSWHEVGLFAGFGLLAVYVLWYLLLGFCGCVDFAGFLMWCLIVFRAYWFWWFSSVCGLSFLLV